MNVRPSSSTAPSPIDGPVAELLLSHLSDEESSLAEMLHAVRNVHHALRHLDDDRLREALEEESHAIVGAGSLQQRRGALRVELASALGVVREEATLGRVVAATTGTLHDNVDRCPWDETKTYLAARSRGARPRKPAARKLDR